MSLAVLLLFLVANGDEYMFNCPKNVNIGCNSTNCSTLDAMERSGFMCQEFPYYTGGWRLLDRTDKIWNDDMHSSSKCITTNEDVCTKWETTSSTHSNMDETCFCDLNSDDTYTCQNWTCHSKQNIEDGLYSIPTAKCECTLYDKSHCIKWNCVELYASEYANISSIESNTVSSAIYNASYQCISDNSTICLRWKADKINLDSSEWKVSTCVCSSNSANSSICFEWSCYERSMSYYSIPRRQFHVCWIVISLAGGIIFSIVFSNCFHPKNIHKSLANKTCRVLMNGLIAFFLLTALLLLCFVISGVMGVLVVCSVWILCILCICPFMKWLCIKRDENYWDYDTETDQELGGYSTIQQRNWLKKKKAVYDFWGGKSREANQSHVTFEYDPYAPL